MPQTAADPSRRRFLAGLAGSVAALAAGGAGPAAALPLLGERRLALHHLRTGESLDVVYYAGGRYLGDRLQAVDQVLRDWRAERAIAIDPGLLDLLLRLQKELGTAEPFQVLCGYRTPETNAWLRRQHRGVAKDSLHMYGMAIDMQLPGERLARLRDAAMDLCLGGVGYYPRAGFVHVDTGPPRYWHG